MKSKTKIGIVFGSIAIMLLSGFNVGSVGSHSESVLSQFRNYSIDTTTGTEFTTVPITTIPLDTQYLSPSALVHDFNITDIVWNDDFEHDTYIVDPPGAYLADSGMIYSPANRFNNTNSPIGNPYSPYFYHDQRGMIVGDDSYQGNYSIDAWGVSSYRKHNGTKSLWCAQIGNASWGYNNATTNSAIHRIDQNMSCYYENYFPLLQYDSVSLSFWYWQQTSAPGGVFKDINGNWASDFGALYILNTSHQWWNATNGGYYWRHLGNQTSWTHVTINIPTNTHLWGFYYNRGVGNRTLFEGMYIDDIVMTGYKHVQIANPSDVNYSIIGTGVSIDTDGNVTGKYIYSGNFHMSVQAEVYGDYFYNNYTLVVPPFLDMSGIQNLLSGILPFLFLGCFMILIIEIIPSIPIAKEKGGRKERKN